MRAALQPSRIPVGRKFGRLTVLEAAEKDRQNKARWLCRCECGRTKDFDAYNVKSGSSLSCGCLRDETCGNNFRTHGHAKKIGKSVEYMTWLNLIARCDNPKNPAYPRYGGRGIRVCHRWNDFAKFIQDMGQRPSPEHSIDRIDNNGDYSPDNCRWATRSQQCRNRSNTLCVTIREESVPLIDLCGSFGISPDTLRWRLRAGWPVEKALNHPVRESNRGERP